ncbi:AMP-binding protein [Vibrio sp. PP-XX7]
MPYSRSARLSLVFNSILEVGAIHLPLDVSYPLERLNYMIKDANPKLIITDTANQAQFAAVAPVLLMDEACISSIGSVLWPPVTR